jgi:hypothetical protein
VQHGEGEAMPIYDIRVQGRLDQCWSSWFDGLTISYESEDNKVLRGSLFISPSHRTHPHPAGSSIDDASA